MVLLKNVRLSERFRMQIRSEFFNYSITGSFVSRAT
jgi:hypothetical protein